MAALGALSCSTSIAQTLTFGLISSSVFGLCSSNKKMCCTSTTVRTIEFSNSTEIEVEIDPPNILMIMLPGFYRSTYYEYTERGSCSFGNCGRSFPSLTETSRRFRRQSPNETETVGYDCVASSILQSVMGVFFLSSLPNLISACSAPPVFPPPPIFIPPLPSLPAPIIPITVFLQPAVVNSDFTMLGASLPSDGCSRDEVLVEGTCSRLLESGPSCPLPQWVVLNATTNPPQGSCGPRLCGRGRVFLVSDQLCHDVREPGLCPGDRRLYISAYGSPVCDCFEGEFPDENGNCFPIFSQGPCPSGQIWSAGDNETATFTCQPQRCPTGGIQAEVPFGEDSVCHPLGSQGPCQPGELLGFSISMGKAVCTTLEEAGYEEPVNMAIELDAIYPRFAPPDFQVDLPNILNNRLVKRQIGNIVSDPVTPDIILNIAPNPGTILETPLLMQCRPGEALDVNFKCRDIILGPNIDTTVRGVHAPPVPPLQGCPDNLCFNVMAQCVACDQAVTDTCNFSASLNLNQSSCQAIAIGLG